MCGAGVSLTRAVGRVDDAEGPVATRRTQSTALDASDGDADGSQCRPRWKSYSGSVRHSCTPVNTTTTIMNACRISFGFRRRTVAASNSSGGGANLGHNRDSRPYVYCLSTFIFGVEAE